MVAQADDTSQDHSKDEMADLMLAYIKEMCMAFAAQHATAVIKDPKFEQLASKSIKEFVVRLGHLQLLKT